MVVITYIFLIIIIFLSTFILGLIYYFLKSVFKKINWTKKNKIILLIILVILLSITLISFENYKNKINSEEYKSQFKGD